MASDLKTFREMSVPYETSAAANAAWLAFWDDLCELRKKHRIKTVYVIANMPVARGDDEVTVTPIGHLGDRTMRTSLTAFAYGYEKAGDAERLRDLVRIGEEAAEDDNA